MTKSWFRPIRGRLCVQNRVLGLSGSFPVKVYDVNWTKCSRSSASFRLSRGRPGDRSTVCEVAVDDVGAGDVSSVSNTAVQFFRGRPRPRTSPGHPPGRSGAETVPGSLRIASPEVKLHWTPNRTHCVQCGRSSSHYMHSESSSREAGRWNLADG